MNDEEFGAADDYRRAFEVIRAEGIPDNHVALLRAHYAAPDHTSTWAQLAVAVGYANGKAVNLQYGTLAGRVAALLGIDQPPKGFWLNVLAGSADERDAVSGHTAFVLRRPVIQALTRLGILPGTAIELLPDELDGSAPIREGARYQVLVNAYERDPEARRQCIAAHGTSCCVCGFTFGAVYGDVAEGYIHVHHLRPLSELGREYVVDPIEDLRPVCPNCHAVLHLGGRCRSIEEVKELVECNRA
jgi:putative restriction endonuclease